MVATQFKTINVLEIGEDGRMVVQPYGWDNQTEYTECLPWMNDERIYGSGVAWLGAHHRPWVGINLTWLDPWGDEGLNFNNNPVASRLLGESIDGPVIFSGVIPDNESRSDDDLLEMSDLTESWGPYLPTDVPFTLVAKAIEAYLEVHGEFAVLPVPPSDA